MTYKLVYYIYKKSFTFKRFGNLLKILLSYILSLLLRKPIVWGYPPMLMIEPTNICNLQCPLCPSGAGLLTRERGFITFDLFKKIVDEVAPYTFMLILWNQGEPFLHPDFGKMVAYATEKGLFSMVSTNANIMPSTDEIIKSGMDVLIVSLDGATQDTYNKYRLNGTLETVMTNVSHLVQTKKAFKVIHPRIVWQFLVMRHNEHEIDAIQNMAKEMEVDELALKTVQIYTKDDIEYLPTNQKYSRYMLPDNSSPITLHSKIKNRCYRLWLQPVVNWDGEFSVCCFDKDNSFKFGNIKDKTFFHIWKSDQLKHFRKTILKNRKQYEMCCNCGEGVSLQIKN